MMENQAVKKAEFNKTMAWMILHIANAAGAGKLRHRIKMSDIIKRPSRRVTSFMKKEAKETKAALKDIFNLH